MSRIRAALTLPLALCLLLGAGAASRAEADPGPGTRPPDLLVASDFPDPDVIEVDGTYHAYSTSSGGKGVVPHATAPSPEGPWTVQQDVFTTEPWPAWIRTTHGFWAPDVSQRRDGTFLLYFTARNDLNGRMCLGAATASSPDGPFVPRDEPLVCRPEEGGNIDASSFVDDNGATYLLYKNDGNAVRQPSVLWLQRTDAAGTRLVGQRRELLRNDRASDDGVIEAPTLVRRGDRYVLLFSAGVYSTGNYHTGYATAGRIQGPYERAYRPLLTTSSLDGAVDGPGGQDVVGDHLIFHGHLAAGGRGMYRAALGWDGDRPVVSGSRDRTEAEHGRLQDAVVRQAVDSASGDAVVGKIDHDTSHVELDVVAPETGSYTVWVRYAAGAGDATHVLTVNGADPVTVSYPARGWSVWSQVAVEVTLREGTNTIRLQHGTRYAELDFIEVA
ncbi:family 43 glycosylhydrolase [Auraticoccus monumenti]|uniref:Carbohydrate binding module (Family 35) n=1 Tax=Auraticoccus monumenti TaxID=675864 RepID=A0A1G7C7D8_9ACTN|nr:family 43 glycosylhydrolase [Auraticoccus monumenti]SDE35241.1 Carbohydrate binding module (family 35) [Auraticoccus monumenti]